MEAGCIFYYRYMVFTDVKFCLNILFFSRDCDEKICLEIERGLMEKVLLG